MRALGWIAGVAMLVLVGQMMPDSKEKLTDKADKARFCALSPVERDHVVRSHWERESIKPGSQWRNYAEFSRFVRGPMGC